MGYILDMAKSFDKGASRSAVNLDSIIDNLSERERTDLFNGDFESIQYLPIVRDLKEIAELLDSKFNEIEKEFNYNQVSNVLDTYKIVYTERISVIRKLFLNYIYVSGVRERFGNPKTLTSVMIDSILESKECFSEINNVYLSQYGMSAEDYGKLLDMNVLLLSPSFRDRLVSDITRSFDLIKYMKKEEEYSNNKGGTENDR